MHAPMSLIPASTRRPLYQTISLIGQSSRRALRSPRSSLRSNVRSPHVLSTPSRLRPHLRPLDLASSSPPATPSAHLASFASAQSASGPASVPRSASSHVTTFSLNVLDSSQSNESNSIDSTTYNTNSNCFNLTHSPTLSSRQLARTIAPASPVATKRFSFDSLSRRTSHTLSSPSTTTTRIQGHGPINIQTPPLTPSSSFTSVSGTVLSDAEHDETGEKHDLTLPQRGHPAADADDLESCNSWLCSSAARGQKLNGSEKSPVSFGAWDAQFGGGQIKAKANCQLPRGVTEDKVIILLVTEDSCLKSYFLCPLRSCAYSQCTDTSITV